MDIALLYYIVPSGLALASLIVLVVIHARKIPQLRSIDLEAMPEYRQRLQRDALIKNRFSRKIGQSKVLIRNISLPVVHVIETLFKNLYKRLLKLENHYKMMASGNATTLAEEAKQQQSAMAIIQAADALLAQEKYSEAEKQYIAAITLDQTAQAAYIGLVKIYRAQKNYTHAIETLKFLVQLDSENETAWQDIANIYKTEHKLDDALEAYEQALKISPNNPKNLDAYIELAILNKLKYKAQSGLDRLTAVNPDNQKLKDYQAQIDAL
ncbi:MAG: tetratricopeptide repeat protein [Patescibacteria group bacterium]|jgi:tetratricopeptide (TPR) repeat protein